MTKIIQNEWFDCDDINKLPKGLPVNQVYGWIYINGKLLLVSKDNKTWQFPGGHPKDSDRDYLFTLKREVREESGFDLSPFTEYCKLFGYYIVKEFSGDTITDEYLQIRFAVRVDCLSTKSYFKPEENQEDEDKIISAGFFTVEEVKGMISWVAKSREFRSFGKLLIL